MIEQHAEPLAATAKRKVVLQLEVKNHPGVMSHVCNLFARRAFNVEGILCMPLPDSRYSRVWLQVDDDQRLEQMLRQVGKLEDVLMLRRHDDGHEIFDQLDAFFV